jgi:hypothetical protein
MPVVAAELPLFLFKGFYNAIRATLPKILLSTHYHYKCLFRRRNCMYFLRIECLDLSCSVIMGFARSVSLGIIGFV